MPSTSKGNRLRRVAACPFLPEGPARFGAATPIRPWESRTATLRASPTRILAKPPNQFSSCLGDVSEHEAVAHDDVAECAGDGAPEDWPAVDKGVELAVFPAGVDFGW